MIAAASFGDGPGPGKVVRGLGPFLLQELRRAGVVIEQGPWPIGDGSVGVTVATNASLPREVMLAVGANVVTITNVGPPYLQQLGYDAPADDSHRRKGRVRLS